MRFLLISTERIGPRMAAAGIRYFELGRALRADGELTCLAPAGSEPVAGLEDLHTYDRRSPAALARAAATADAVFSPPLAPRLAAALLRGGRPWVVDLINPEPFEGLEYHRTRRPWERRALATLRLDRLSYALRRGSAFACAGERQRDMWLGMLAACRRLDPDRYEGDPQFRGLLEVVPSGVDETPPERPPAPVLRGSVLPADARIVLWNGGLWDWLDPQTAIEAVSLLHGRDDRWRLHFMSTGRPSLRSTMRAADAVTGASSEIVSFNPNWVPYAERAGYLLEADVCISTHRPTLESRFAYRNRLLDCVWAGLPLVCTEGDSIADLVREHSWGRVVAAGDPQGAAEALEAVVEADRSSFEQSMARWREHRTWAAAAARLRALAAAASSGPGAPRGLDLAAGLARARHTAASALRPPADEARTPPGG